jgi:hypothetical protein
VSGLLGIKPFATNKSNIIKAVKTGTSYAVYINDTLVHTFAEDNAITGNRIGFQVSVGMESEESFPNTPVDVRFKQK